MSDPIICACVTDPSNSNKYLVDTIDTIGNAHTADQLAEIADSCIKKCNEKFLCKIGGVVTDNASNMRSMRTKLGTSSDESVRSVFTYGCSAHLANLICKDIKDDSFIDKVKSVRKYFRNHLDPRAKFKDAGGKSLALLCDVRWDTYRDCLSSFAKNYVILTSVASNYKHVFDPEIINIILEENLLTSAQVSLQKLDKVGIAFDKL